MRVKPWRSNLSLGNCKKLSPRYCKLFRVLKRIRDLAYRLELPPHIRVHNVFHVSLLKPYVPDNFLRISVYVPINETGTFEMVPVYLLDSREKTLRG